MSLVITDSTPLLEPLGAVLTWKGKVRDTYDLDDRLLIVATDRISTFDVVHPNGVPDKGKVLTQLSAFWFELVPVWTSGIVPTHFIRLADGSAADELPFTLPPELVGRTMIVRRARRVDIECVVRGYLSGLGWQDYQATGSVCGIKLPADLRESDRLPEPIFTPSTKAEGGAHDVNISFEQAAEKVGHKTALELRGYSLYLYRQAAEYARKRGIIIADTKFEFGWSEIDGQEQLIVIDEMLTPDSSRFWPADGYEPGHSQPSFDKQPVRDWATATGWNKKPPAPTLPPEVVAATAKRYREIFRLLTGREIT